MGERPSLQTHRSRGPEQGRQQQRLMDRSLYRQQVTTFIPFSVRQSLILAPDTQLSELKGSSRERHPVTSMTELRFRHD
jgi:hypothetical protein